MFQALQGIETVDLDKNSTFKDYATSKLILYPTFQLIRNGIYFASLAIILFLFYEQKTEIELVIYWALVGLIIEIPLTIYIYRLVKKSFKLKIAFSSLTKYLISTVVVFGVTYLGINEFLEYNISIFEFLPPLIGFAAISIIGYVALTFAIDDRTKILIKAIFNELIPKRNNN